MTGGTTSIHGHTTDLTASEAHGTGADIGAHTGAGRLGATAGMTHGSTDGATLGITEDIGEDGTIRGITGDTGDGMTHGTTEDIGEATGIRIMQAGTEASVLTGDITIMEDRDSDMADISAATDGMDREARPRRTEECSPVLKRPHTEEASARAAASAAA